MAESEDGLTIRHVAERLLKAHPELAAKVVEDAVRTAYEELRYTRVRTYLPVLMERRAKDLLPSTGRPIARPDVRRASEGGLGAGRRITRFVRTSRPAGRAWCGDLRHDLRDAASSRAGGLLPGSAAGCLADQVGDGVGL
ncbi:three-helix bundle dimerization domain-containing protein [Streptomyces sp. NPDC054945]